MPKVELDKIEEYLVEQAKGAENIRLSEWIRNRFAELRAREDAKAFM